jgi:hypothetical protein
LRRCRGAVIAEKGSSQANIPATGEQQMKIKSVLKPKHVAWASGALVAAILGVAVSRSAAKPSTQTPSSPVVEVAPVEQRDVPIYGEWIGTLTGQVNADVKAQVTGYLLTRNYKEGSFVRKGQILFEIDPRPFQAALDQASCPRYTFGYLHHTGVWTRTSQRSSHRSCKERRRTWRAAESN